MKRSIFLAFTLCCIAVRALALESAQITPDEVSVHTGVKSYTVLSGCQKGPNKLEVLLPDGFSPSKRYPVFYLLPVNIGTDGQWGSGIVEAQKNNLHNQYGAIFVAPAYDTLPWFGDNPERPEIRQNTYLLEVVIPFIEKEFPVIAEQRGRLLIGFSKSGLGALGLFFLHPTLFDKVAVFDSCPGPPTQKSYVEWGFAETYGPRENYDKYDPFQLIQKNKEQFKGEPVRIALLAGGPGSRIGVDALHSKLLDSAIPHIYILGTNQSHTWTSGWLPLAVASIAYPVTVTAPAPTNPKP